MTKFFITSKHKQEFYEAYQSKEPGKNIIAFLNKNFNTTEARESKHYEALHHFAGRLIETPEVGMILGMAYTAWDKYVAEHKNEWSLVSEQELMRWSADHFENFPTTKEQAFNPLKRQSITFDYALPQDWLNWFVKESGLDYHLVLGTTVWSYRERMQGPVSCCEEVQVKLEELYYKEK